MKHDSESLRVSDYSSLPDGSWNTSLISDSQNAMGVKPFQIMYLWVFERPDSLCAQFVANGWVFLGSVNLLVSPNARVRSPLMRSHQDIDNAAKLFRNEAGRYRCPKLIDYEVYTKYFGYPVNCLWCTDKTWEYGFKLLASRCQKFVIDLTTDERPDGLLKELFHVFNTIPAENVVFLADIYRAKIDLIREILYSAWDAMISGSVNQGKGKQIPPLITYKSSSPVFFAKAALSQWTGTSKVHFARKVAHFLNWDRS